MKKLLLISIITLMPMSFTGCSLFKSKLKDYPNNDRVGISVNTEPSDLGSYSTRSMKIYFTPYEKNCIDLKQGKYIDVYDTEPKSIGIPKIAFMSDVRREFWVPANHYITIKLLTSSSHSTTTQWSFYNKIETISFKPQQGDFYYINPVMPNIRKNLKGEYMVDGPILIAVKLQKDVNNNYKIAPVDKVNLQKCDLSSSKNF